MELTLQTIKDWVGLFNVLLVPLVIYIVRIENKMTVALVRQSAHEEVDKERFEALFRRVERLEGASRGAAQARRTLGDREI